MASNLFRSVGAAVTTWFIFDRQYTRKLRVSSKNSKGILLDIGCGTKPYKHLFEHDKYIGIDVPWSEIDTEADIIASGEDLPFKKDSFDTVLLMEMLEHTKKPDTIIKEASRVIKRNGIIIISMPQVFISHGNPYDYQRYTINGLRNILENNGFEIKDHHKICGVWGSTGLMLVLFFSNVYGLENRKTKIKHIMKIFVWPLCFITQVFFTSMDILNRHAGDPANNIVVAVKKSV